MNELELNQRGNNEINLRVWHTEKSYQQWKWGWERYSPEQSSLQKSRKGSTAIHWILTLVLASIRRLPVKQAELVS